MAEDAGRTLLLGLELGDGRLLRDWAGAGYLVWIGIKGLRAKPGKNSELAGPPTSGSAARDGFLVAFLNPKVALFFIALFSQVIGSETTLLERLAFAATAMSLITTPLH